MMRRIPLRWLIPLAVAALAAGLPRPTTAEPPAGDEKKPHSIIDGKPLEPEAGDDLRKLLKELYNAALDMGWARFQEYEAGRGTLDILLEAGRYLLRAELEL